MVLKKENIMNVYFDLFSSNDDIIREFAISPEQLDGVEVLYAYYGYEDWSGDAHVIFRKDGKLYEVNGSHCSCYGLNEQWEPAETTVKALLFRPNVAEAAKEILRAL